MVNVDPMVSFTDCVSIFRHCTPHELGITAHINLSLVTVTGLFIPLLLTFVLYHRQGSSNTVSSSAIYFSSFFANSRNVIIQHHALMNELVMELNHDSNVILQLSESHTFSVKVLPFAIPDLGINTATIA